MAEIAIVEKAPGYRLDHPDFGVVNRVTFAKGIITKFKKTSDDPIKVEAMAKVKINDEETEFLPFFFRAKEGFWDTPDHKAQDIDQEKKSYPNAWQSFRPDDEVKVMLVEGKPFAIVGFLDGVPRIGEDIIKVETTNFYEVNHTVHIQCSKKGEQYRGLDEEGNGPDGLDLGLKQEAILLCQTHKEDSVFLGYYDFTSHPAPQGPNCWYSQTAYHYWDYYEWLVPVGSILYIFQCFGDNSRIWIENYINPHLPYEPGWTDYLTNTSPFSVLAAPYTKENYDVAIATGASHAGLDPNDIDENNWNHIGERGYWLSYPGFQYQEEFTMKLFNNDNLNRMYYTNKSSFDITKFKFHIRPHTKAELKKAGLWPI